MAPVHCYDPVERVGDQNLSDEITQKPRSLKHNLDSGECQEAEAVERHQPRGGERRLREDQWGKEVDHQARGLLSGRSGPSPPPSGSSVDEGVEITKVDTRFHKGDMQQDDAQPLAPGIPSGAVVPVTTGTVLGEWQTGAFTEAGGWAAASQPYQPGGVVEPAIGKDGTVIPIGSKQASFLVDPIPIPIQIPMTLPMLPIQVPMQMPMPMAPMPVSMPMPMPSSSVELPFTDASADPVAGSGAKSNRTKSLSSKSNSNISVRKSVGSKGKRASVKNRDSNESVKRASAVDSGLVDANNIVVEDAQAKELRQIERDLDNLVKPTTTIDVNWQPPSGQAPGVDAIRTWQKDDEWHSPNKSSRPGSIKSLTKTRKTEPYQDLKDLLQQSFGKSKLTPINGHRSGGGAGFLPLQPINTAAGNYAASGFVSSSHRRAQSNPSGKSDDARDPLGIYSNRRPSSRAAENSRWKLESGEVNSGSMSFSSVALDRNQTRSPNGRYAPPSRGGYNYQTMLGLDPFSLQENAQGRIDDILREKGLIGGERRRVASARTPKEEEENMARRKQSMMGGKLLGLSMNAEEREKERLLAIRGMGLFEIGRDSRLDAVTSLTARMLNTEVCMLTIVDNTAVYWWSVCDRGGFLSPELTKESRADSFCHYAIRDDKRGGFVVLDASREQRFKDKPMAKRGLEFYAGAPLVTSGGVKIGALSVRGPARKSFTAQEADILRQMTEWATGEVEMLTQRRDAEQREAFQIARLRLAELEKRRNWDEDGAQQTIAQAKNIMILKIATGTDGVIRSVVHSLAVPCQLNAGDEKFTDLCMMCLDKKAASSPFSLDSSLMLDPLPVSIQLQVGRFVGQDVSRCCAELIWSYSRPAAMLVAFFAGKFRPITHLEEKFTSHAAIQLSSLWERMDTHLSLSHVLSPSTGGQYLKSTLQKLRTQFHATNARTANKRVSTVSTSTFGTFMTGHSYMEEHGASFSVTPFAIVVEPVTPPPRRLGSAPPPPALGGKAGSSHSLVMSGTVGGEPKGMAQAQAIAMMRSGRGGDAEVTLVEHGEETDLLGTKGSVELFADFSQMFDVLAEQHGIGYVRKRVAVTGLNDDNKTCHDLISLVLDLTLTLAEYGQETGVYIQARIGIHGDTIDGAMADDLEALESAWSSLVNTAYHLECISNATILVSDFVKTKAESLFKFMPRGTIFMRGLGCSKSFVLIGPQMGAEEEENEDDDSFRQVPGENKDGMLSVAARVRKAREKMAEKERVEAETKALQVKDAKKDTVKSKTCSVM
ncbi:hypothetical protein HK101_009294 [Irineochytrium annulatum]|nr:hypothetical protein HK101_009294 [Irineochytrium annulatum]